MSFPRVAWLALAWVLPQLCATHERVLAQPTGPEVAQLVYRAGNAEDDAVRLDLLRKLQAFPGTDAALRADAGQMVAAVERWLDSRHLTYFGGEVSRTLDSLVTGDPGGSGYCAMNAVRWRTSPRGIAAIVTDSSGQRFSAELFHFGREPRKMSADFYLLTPGSYTLTMTTCPQDAQPAVEILRCSLPVSGPVTRVDLEIPSQQPVRLNVRRQAGDGANKR